MRIITILNDIENKGFKLQNLARSGILCSKVISYREIYLRYLANKATCQQRMDVLAKTCEELKVSEAKVYRSIKLMEQE